MIVGRSEAWTGRLLLILLMVITIVPFVSLFTTAIHPSRAVPLGIAWPDDPQWGNFLEAFDQAHMGALMVSSVLIVLGVVPVAVVFATMAGFALGHLRTRQLRGESHKASRSSVGSRPLSSGRSPTMPNTLG